MSSRQDHKETGLVKMLTYLLGVNPAELGLVPDAEGWVPVKDLIKALSQEDGWRGVRETMVRDAASRLAPEALEMDEGRIRSRQRKPPAPQPGVEPPAHVYVGVRRRGWPVIKDRGLAAPPGGWVMLAADREHALRLGRRRDAEPVMVTVQAQRAMDQGVMFWGFGEGLFLAEWVPADCLMGPPVEPRPVKPAKPAGEKPKPRPGGPRLPPPEAMPGSFLPSAEDLEKPFKRKGIEKRVQWKDERRKGRRKDREPDWD